MCRPPVEQWRAAQNVTVLWPGCCTAEPGSIPFSYGKIPSHQLTYERKGIFFPWGEVRRGEGGRHGVRVSQNPFTRK